MTTSIEKLPQPKPQEGTGGRRRSSRGSHAEWTQTAAAGEQVANRILQSAQVAPEELSDRDWWRGRQHYIDSESLAAEQAVAECCAEDSFS